MQIQPSEAPAVPSHPGPQRQTKKQNKKLLQKIIQHQIFFFLYIIFTAILLKQPQERGKKNRCVNINNDSAVSLSYRSSKYLNYCSNQMYSNKCCTCCKSRDFGNNTQLAKQKLKINSSYLKWEKKKNPTGKNTQALNGGRKKK